MLVEFIILFFFRSIFSYDFNKRYKLILFLFFNALFIKFKYCFLYWAYYNFYLINICLFLIENVKRFSITIRNSLLGPSRNFSGNIEKNSQQCAATIKLKTSKLYGCRCPYKVKFGIFCGKRNVNFFLSKA